LPPPPFALAGTPFGMLCFPRSLAARSVLPRLAPDTALLLAVCGAREGAAAGRLARLLSGMVAGLLAGLLVCGAARPRS
jgi:hypothetical protein